VHSSALKLGEKFFRTYVSGDSKRGVVVDLGSQDILGSLRGACPPNFKYLGVDFEGGKNVDLVLENPYEIPFEDNSVDIIVCSSVFEHSQFFWKLFLEILRILKPNGLLYLNAPSNGYIHRYPVDCWRFYPDAGLALVDWGVENGFNPALLESFIADKDNAAIDEGWWNDFVAVFVKDASESARYEDRILHSITGYSNAHSNDSKIVLNSEFYPPDYRLNKKIELEFMGASETIKAKDALISHLESAVSEASETIKAKDALISHLESAVGDLSHQMNLIIHSRSWRITKPLRGLKRLLR
jgi:SAM-dependent methyltransferase